LAALSRQQHDHDRRPGPRRAVITGSLVVLCVLVLGAGAGYAWHSTKGGSGSGTAMDAPLSATSRPPGTKPSAEPSVEPTAVPLSGTGRFSTAQATGTPAGHGEVRRYKVQVEGGIELSASDAAHEIAGILADPRGWTADGHDAFRLVSSGPADFVIKIATPDTVDDICGEAGLDTGGEVNCDVGATVVVNLKRWELGSPEFAGPLHDYRALIINHEVGHRIGHGHEGCPGRGRLAPVMMQQIKGLHGCVANAWPYDRRGHYVSGPPTA
jgi:hypothetical protein